MNEPANFIEKKVANALIPTAESIFPMGAQAGLVLKWFKGFYRGLWVGGMIYLLPDCLDFRPNAMNRFFHEGDVSFRVPLADITSLSDQFGLVTRIVVAKLRNGAEFKFRCYGAADFAGRIRSQIEVDRAARG
jgi:hypothetical protein